MYRRPRANLYNHQEERYELRQLAAQLRQAAEIVRQHLVPARESWQPAGTCPKILAACRAPVGSLPEKV